MKPILLLGPDRPGGPTLERWHVNMHRTTLAEETLANAPAYSSVIVINGGDAETVRRLLTALEMHQRDKHLCVGVLTYLDEAAGADHLTRDLFAISPGSRPPDPLLPVLRDLGSRLRIELKDARLSLEYQAV